MRLRFWSDSQRQYLRHQSKSGTSPPSLKILDSARRTIEIITATIWRCFLRRTERRQTRIANGWMDRQTMWQITSFYIWLFAVDVEKRRGRSQLWLLLWAKLYYQRPNKGALSRWGWRRRINVCRSLLPHSQQQQTRPFGQWAAQVGTKRFTSHLMPRHWSNKIHTFKQIEMKGKPFCLLYFWLLFGINVFQKIVWLSCFHLI